jgi:beta-1,4-N-acetylglucosaminyltransferase
MAPPWVKLIPYGLLFVAICGTIALILCIRALSISQNSIVPKWRRNNSPTHLLVVLGSGGHTAEMFSMLRRMKLDPSTYTYRTYVVSSGDNFSAARAVEFETEWLKQSSRLSFPANGSNTAESYAIVTVPRARRVHQSYLTAPLSTLQCFYACLLVLRGCHPEQKSSLPRTNSPYPDVILTNGPATAVCMILAAKLLRLSHYLGSLFNIKNRHDRDSSRSSHGKRSEDAPAPVYFQLRTIYVESWARVTTFSLSGKLLLPFADRFLVQWPDLAGKQAWRGMRKTEYAGTLVD